MISANWKNSNSFRWMRVSRSCHDLKGYYKTYDQPKYMNDWTSTDFSRRTSQFISGSFEKVSPHNKQNVNQQTLYTLLRNCIKIETILEPKYITSVQCAHIMPSSSSSATFRHFSPFRKKEKVKINIVCCSVHSHTHTHTLAQLRDRVSEWVSVSASDWWSII